MNRSDLFMMALQNLWARKSRTAFNIFGIVVSCSMLLLVFAGTRGARDGLMNLFSQSDFATQFAIIQGRGQSAAASTPEKMAGDLKNGVSMDRMERISEKLNRDWKRKNLPITPVTLAKLDEIRQLPNIVSVLPNQTLRVQMEIEDQKIAASTVCFSAQSSNLERRVVVGAAPQQDSSQGKIWIDEYRAWRLGHKTDQQLEELIGKKVKLRFQVAAASLSPNMKRFATLFGVRDSAETEQIAEALRKLFADADQTSLSEIEQEAVGALAQRLGIDSASLMQDLPDGKQPFVFREFEIAGILKPPAQTSSSLFRIARGNRGSDLLIDWRDFQAIEKETHPNRTYYYSVGFVADSADLKKAVEVVESEGLDTHSALEILEKADVELGKIRLIVAAIALVILLIASVGIMNTMIIAVMERTPEFGIMKAVGARDADIRWLMLIEAAFTGILGAIVSLGAARMIDICVSQFARGFIETRIRHDFDFSIFVYSIGDALIVTAIAIIVCTLASLIPSRRAAKLDPVTAMN